MCNCNDKKFIITILTAFILWFLLFSPFTQGYVNFWLQLSLSSLILCITALVNKRDLLKNVFCVCDKSSCRIISFSRNLSLGIIIAAALWGIFWIGNELSTMMFNFAENQIDSIYAIKEGQDKILLSLLLLFLIGPAEEIFWRGYVQNYLHERINPNVGFIIATLLYGMAHIWSLNFMLIMAAMVAGAVWGLIYRIAPRSLPALIISHAIWDAAVFVWFPI